MPVPVRQVLVDVTFAGVDLTDVLFVRGEITADRGWPTCSVFVTAKPSSGNEEDAITVLAGAEHYVTRFTGRVRRFRPSGFPKSIELVCTGTLAYADEWSPDQDFRFGFASDGPDFYGMFPGGGTDQEIIQFVLDQVPGVTYDTANIGGTGIVLGASIGRSGFDWKAGTSAWRYIQNLDRATLYRTYQAHDGTIRRVRMIGHPDNTPDFTFAAEDILEGATGSRNTEQTRNAVEVHGYNYGGNYLMLGSAYQENDFQGDGSDPATRHAEVFSSELIESGSDRLGNPRDFGGLNAGDIANQIILDVNKEFVEASVPSWHDELHGPGMTCLLDCLDRLAIGEPMWVVRHAWEVGDNGWVATYGMTGGGLPQTNPAPPI